MSSESGPSKPMTYPETRSVPEGVRTHSIPAHSGKSSMPSIREVEVNVPAHSMVGDIAYGPNMFPRHGHANMNTTVNLPKDCREEEGETNWYFKISTKPKPNVGFPVDKEKLAESEPHVIHLLNVSEDSESERDIPELTLYDTEKDLTAVKRYFKLDGYVEQGNAQEASERRPRATASQTEKPSITNLFGLLSTNTVCCGNEDQETLQNQALVVVDSEYLHEASQPRTFPVTDHNGTLIGFASKNAVFVELSDGSYWVKTKTAQARTVSSAFELTDGDDETLTSYTLREEITLGVRTSQSSQDYGVRGGTEMKRASDSAVNSVYTWIAPAVQGDDLTESELLLGQSYLEEEEEEEEYYSYTEEYITDDETETAQRNDEVNVPGPSMIHGGSELMSPQYGGRFFPVSYRLHAVEVHQFIDSKLTPDDEETVTWFQQNNINPSTQSMFGSLPLPFNPDKTGLVAPMMTHGKDLIPRTTGIANKFTDTLPTKVHNYD